MISPSVATLILTASSFTLLFGLRALDRGSLGRFRSLVLWTFGLGGAFLAIKAYELSAAPFGVRSHAYGSLWWRSPPPPPFPGAAGAPRGAPPPPGGGPPVFEGGAGSRRPDLGGGRG